MGGNEPTEQTVPSSDPDGRTKPFALLPHIIALRPHQWTKNGLVFAAFFFALGDQGQEVGLEAFIRVCLATALFCLTSSSIYLINDSSDREADRKHPTKRFRPIAAGSVKVRTALIMSALLALGSLTAAWFLSPKLMAVLAAYLVMQIAYTFYLKRIALLDVIIIAIGFILRAVAGAVAINVIISNWLLGCTFLLALFLGLSKRRHEKVVLSHVADSTRKNLGQLPEKLLDQLILGVAVLAALAYAAYTVWPDTVAKFGSYKLALTIPFVLLGLWRYFFLVYRKQEGGRPEKVLLTDPPMIGILLAYAAVLLALFLF